MINSFEITNFRNLDGLLLNNLVRVNLITGKNNTGKTNLLQAIELFVSDFNHDILKRQLSSRREILQSNNNILLINDDKTVYDIFTSLIKNRKIESNSKINFSDKSKKLSIDQGNIEQNIARNINNVQQIVQQYIPAIEVFINEELIKKIGILNNFRSISAQNIKNLKTSSISFIETNNIEKSVNAIMWDNLVFTELQEEIIKSLKIIEENVEDITFIGQSDRYPIVKLKNLENPIPLKSMGDGINRILTIILALVNVKDGYLFIDEFENGLHYSVQIDLWKIIFLLADKLNIQVFATTHSSDCINAFQEVVNEPENQILGQFIRLENKNDEIREVTYTNEEIKYASENDIEVR